MICLPSAAFLTAHHGALLYAMDKDIVDRNDSNGNHTDGRREPFGHRLSILKTPASSLKSSANAARFWFFGLLDRSGA
jgi:hypothetical protein